MDNLNKKRYKILTYGCQMNENDSEKIAGMLDQIGYISVDEVNDATLIIMNTCSVRENADDRFFGNLGEFKILKKKNPDLIIAVCGCMMQQERIVDIVTSKFNFVDIIFGTHNIHNFPELLSEYTQHKNRVKSILKDSDYIPEGLPQKRLFNHKAFVSITFGCDNFCSYCIVPYTRGREKSREPDNILNEIKEAALNGCKEVMLLGQNVNSYGKGLENKISFSELLKQCCDINNIERIRFMTSHPKDFSDDIIEVIKNNDKICNSIHLPVQSGSNEILHLMNRHYTREYYIDLVNKIRGNIDDVTISTDIIVGFPMETEKDFDDTLDIIEKCKFDSAFTFIYSPRLGTKAANIPQQNDKQTLSNRFSRLLELQNNIMAQNVVDTKDKVYEILVDGKSKNNSDTMTGRTRNNRLVNFTGDCKTGDIVNVKITQPSTFYLLGEMLK